MKKHFDFLNDFIVPIFNFIAIILYFIWSVIKFIFSFIWKVICDVAKNVYGRIIMAIGGIVFTYLVYYFHNLHK